MSNEISNKVLASLLVVAIVVSVVGTFFSLSKLGDLSGITGRQVINNTESSTANVTILGVVGIAVTGVIDFGDGTTAESSAVVLTTGAANSNGFNDCTAANCMGIAVQNTGNVNANIKVNSSKTAATFLSGTSPIMQYYATDGDTSGSSGGCASNLTYTSGSRNTLNGTLQNMCTNLSFVDTTDYVTFEMYLSVPSDAPPVTSSTATLTFFATQV